VCGGEQSDVKTHVKLITIDCVLHHSFLSLSWSKKRSSEDRNRDREPPRHSGRRKSKVAQRFSMVGFKLSRPGKR